MRQVDELNDRPGYFMLFISHYDKVNNTFQHLAAPCMSRAKSFYYFIAISRFYSFLFLFLGFKV